MTEFQKQCMEASEKLIQRVLPPGSQVGFAAITGRGEVFYVHWASIQGVRLEIYVYSHEVGFVVNVADWVIFEQTKFSSEQEMIREFSKQLAARLPSGPPPAGGVSGSSSSAGRTCHGSSGLFASLMGHDSGARKHGAELCGFATIAHHGFQVFSLR